MLAELLQFALTIAAGLILYELVEVRRKQKLDTYWKIETEYKSEGQQLARKYVEEVQQDLHQQERVMGNTDGTQAHTELVNYYNNRYHNSLVKEHKEMAWAIRTRIRFLHLCGVLLKKKMIDKDLLLV